jgi:DNA-binding transcriptional MerR regulator
MEHRLGAPREALLSIGALARELGVTTRTIRYYEERGLISPARSEGQQRVYSRKDRGRLKLILRHKDGGFTLDELKELLDLYDTSPNPEGTRKQWRRMREILGARMGELEARVAALNDLRARMREKIELAERELAKS